ncbi:MAG TPA: OsmC family peroxiredoxin [Gaiellaceae bacterium]|nr:OsmC family peroxiredoxin [Gaiellaceae bacterium]
MPRITREAEVSWEGSSARGRGAITAASSGAFAGLPYSEPSRIAASAPETSPEELVAAAHAGCYAMSLAAELTRDRTPPERLEVRAVVVLDEVEGEGHRIVESRLRVRARVPGSDDDAFQEAVRRADAGCPLSALIGAAAAISVDATLEVT